MEQSLKPWKLLQKENSIKPFHKEAQENLCFFCLQTLPTNIFEINLHFQQHTPEA